VPYRGGVGPRGVRVRVQGCVIDNHVVVCLVCLGHCTTWHVCICVTAWYAVAMPWRPITGFWSVHAYLLHQVQQFVKHVQGLSSACEKCRTFQLHHYVACRESISWSQHLALCRHILGPVARRCLHKFYRIFALSFIVPSCFASYCLGTLE